jgi:uncharacterized protein YutE (UPF0331/DUF86 family)
LSWENSCGFLTTELAVSMRKAVGFRNALAQDHIEVAPDGAELPT